jgi:hypothetical protein
VSSVDTLAFQRAGVVFQRYRVLAINVTTAERSLLRHRSLVYIDRYSLSGQSIFNSIQSNCIL